MAGIASQPSRSTTTTVTLKPSPDVRHEVKVRAPFIRLPRGTQMRTDGRTT